MLRTSTWSGIIVTLAIFILPTTLFTQDDPSTRNIYKTMDRMLSMKQYDKAIPLIEKLLEEEPDNANYNFKMAYAIIRGHSHKPAIPHLEKAITDITQRYRSRVRQSSAPFDAVWFLALEHFYNYNYEVAENYFLQYKEHIDELHSNYEMCLHYIDACKSGPELMQNPDTVTLTDFNTVTTLPEYYHSALFSPDESIFIYTTDKNPEKDNYKLEYKAFNDDIFSIHYKDSSWSEAHPIGSNINSPGREASVDIHPNGKMLLVYREDKKGSNIYYSNLLDSAIWSPLKKFPEPINSSDNETHATISAHGNVIYFTSDRKGGYGGLDIYMSKRAEDGTWQEPINLGPEVNTEFHEESPHFQTRSSMLYWSSNRNGGMGGFDIYQCSIEEDSIARNIENIGYPINTPFNDMFFKTTLSGDKAYYSSSCTSTNGEYNFQIVTYKNNIIYPDVDLTGIVIHNYTDTVRNKNIYLCDLTTRAIADSTILDSLDGSYKFKVHSEHEYVVSIEYADSVYFGKPFFIAEYFTDYSFINTIELEPIFVDDTSFKQSNKDFAILRSLNELSDSAEVFDSIQDIFATTDSLHCSTLSRTKTVIDSTAYSIFKHRERILFMRDSIREEKRLANELITTQKMTDSLLAETDTLSSVSEVLDISKILAADKAKIEKPKVDAQINNSFLADSLLSSGIKNMQFGQFSISEKELSQAYALYDSIENIDKQLVCLDYLAENNFISGEYNNALDMHLQSLSILETHKSETEVAEKKEEIGDIYSDLWYTEESIEFFKESLETYKAQNNKAKTTDIYFKMADVLMKNKEFREAIDVLNESLDYITNQYLEAEAYNKIGVSHHQLQKYVRAIEYYNKAINIASKLEEKAGLALYHNNLGNAYFDIDELKEALLHYTISLKLYEEIFNERGIAIVLYNIGNVNRQEKDYTQAIDNFLQSIEFAKKNNYTSILSKNYKALVSVYKAIGNKKLALSYYKLYYSLQSPQNLQDQQLSQYIQKHIVDAKELDVLKHKMLQKEEVYEYEIIKYNKELALLAQQERFLEMSRMALGVVLCGIILLIILLLLRFKTRRKYYKQLSVQHSEILQQQEEISVQRENLEMLNYELEQLSIVASQTANAVTILNPDGTVEWINRAFISYYDTTPHNFYNFVESVEEQKHIHTSIETKQSVVYETQRVQHSRHVWIQCMVTPIIEHNKVTKLILIESDIDKLKKQEIEIKKQRDEIEHQSREIEYERDVAVNQRNEIEQQKTSIEQSLNELQKTQKQLIESEKMASLGNLVAGISHEINTPVGIGIAASSSLFTQTESLKELFESKKMKQSDLQDYLLSTQEASRLIQSNLVRTGNLVKSFKQISVDEMTDNKRTFIVCDYIKEVITSLSAHMSERDFDLHIECPEKIELESYPAAYARIITNMIKNVMHHAYTEDEKHQVKIHIQKVENELLLDFSDYGKGMPPEVVKKVFNPFFTTNMQTGKGLGMSMVFNAVVKQLHGDISCESEEGKGTTYHIRVPLS
ncbi:MAG: tetratricopeptide repeat protein [Bacteroidales bacterium]